MPASDSLPTTRADRRARSEQAILEATRAILAEGGVRGLTIEGVAARSGVAKTTIYRRWRDKDELALAAVWNDLLSMRAPREVGDTRAELISFVQPVVTELRQPVTNRVIRGLTSEIADNPELSRTYREQIIQPRLEQLGALIARGIERGDLRPDTDLRLAHELLIGPVMYRLLYSRQPLDDGLSERIADAVLRAF